MMPFLFIGHGSPLNVIQDNDFTKSLAAMGRKIGKPAAALVISAHWLTRGTAVTSSPNPPQLYDFYGFPDECYAVRYEVTGDPTLAGAVAGLTGDHSVRINSERGIDHGAWAVMRHLYPGADVPMIQLSIDGNLDEAGHVAIAQRLALLRDRGVLVIGSGNLVHNLGQISSEQFDSRHYPWAESFDAWVRDRIVGRDLEALARYRECSPEGVIAHPTDEHYLPLLYVMALVQPSDRIEFFHEGMQHGSLSMRSFIGEGV